MTEYGRRWVVTLAGGDGIRLQPLTRELAGDHRPQQYCRVRDPPGGRALGERRTPRGCHTYRKARELTGEVTRVAMPEDV